MALRTSSVLWGLSGLLALTFLVTGGSKLAAVPPSPENFARWGFSTTFMYAVGAIEVLGAIGLLVRAVAPFAAAILIATMFGAIKTGVQHREPLHVLLPLALIALLAIVLYGRLRARGKTPQ